jgi:hypothetical protein
MGSDGHARRLSLSLSFLWIIGCLSLATLGALGLVGYLWVEADRARDSLANRLEYVTRQNEMTKYQQDLKVAPDQARRLLEELDLAARVADADGSAGQLIQSIQPQPTQSNNSAASQEGKPDEGASLGGSATGLGDKANASPVNSEGEPGKGNLALVSPDQGLDVASPREAGSAGGPGGESALASSPDNISESEAWKVFWAKWPAPKENTGSKENTGLLVVEDFKLFGGQFSYVLKRLEPGQRVRGRSATILAVADAAGKVKLKPFPEFNLKEPGAGYKAGARYNILSSKVVRGKVAIPEGGRVLSVEIVAWDEDSRELVFRQRIRLEER